MKKILFVCTGNTCRSAMAQGIFNDIAKKKGIDALSLSCGLCAQNGCPATSEAIEALREIGVDISGHRSHIITREVANQADLIVPMTESHRAALSGAVDGGKLAPAAGIPDPFGGNIDVYRRCRDEIVRLCERIANDCN